MTICVSVGAYVDIGRANEPDDAEAGSSYPLIGERRRSFFSKPEVVKTPKVALFAGFPGPLWAPVIAYLTFA